VSSTTIEWTRNADGTAGRTWNPVTGCTKVSPGCDRCYAEGIARRFAGSAAFPRGFEVTLHPQRLAAPLRWRKPTTVFVNSMADLWHDAVGADLIARVFAVITLADQHTFQVLTKRSGRMQSLLGDERFWARVRAVVPEYGPVSPAVASALDTRVLPNLWLGVSVESQKWASVRLDKLAAISAGAVRFVSCEPLLGEVDLRAWLGSGLDWVIVGGESGAGARPLDTKWVRGLVGQCRAARVPVFVKQLGTRWDAAHGRRGKGGDIQTWPADLRVREMPPVIGPQAVTG
jgi:protein gp37